MTTRSMPRGSGTTPDTSAVWKIVEEWSSGIDDEGVPFRGNVYAVKYGF